MKHSFPTRRSSELPIGLPVVEFLEPQQSENSGTYVFSGPRGEDTAFGGFPNHWGELFLGSPLEGVTPHALRNSFASLGNDPVFPAVTLQALMVHGKGHLHRKYFPTPEEPSEEKKGNRM